MPKEFVSEHNEDVETGAKKRRKAFDDVRTPVADAPARRENDEYTICLICALSVEYIAAQAFLDEKLEGPEYVSPHDNNDYTLGKIRNHNVVIAVSPKREWGLSTAATVATHMIHSFPNVAIVLMVGIGGGAPSPRHDIRLGDIVVSVSHCGEGVVFQYDFGKRIQNQRFLPTGFSKESPTILQMAVNRLKDQYNSEGHRLEEGINGILEKNPRLRKLYKRPSTDRLYRSEFVHVLGNGESCAAGCDPSCLVLRRERTEDEDNPAIHYGLIASGNQLIKDALFRDSLVAEKDVLCFETEAAGVMNNFPCLVIRGISNYSDTHRNVEWQGYAAMAAAAYAKDLLYRILPNKAEAPPFQPVTPPVYESRRPRDRNDFDIAIICALQIESDAVEALFDEIWDDDCAYGKAPTDPNSYTTGRIGDHNAVLAFMPGMGKGTAASVAANFRSSFPQISLGLVVGICGGVPIGIDNEILLGDIVISTGLVQYDFGRQLPNKFIIKDTLEESLGRQTSEIRSFLKRMAGFRSRTRLATRTSAFLDELCNKEGLEESKYPGANEDKLYEPTYRHKHQDSTSCTICAKCKSSTDEVCKDALKSSCSVLGCSDSEQVLRSRLKSAEPTAASGTGDREAAKARMPLIHFGRIASGDLVMKSGSHRDEVASREEIIAFEMEGAGVWDNFPTIVIKAVCDYADSHKNKRWQGYAAAAAAACTKALLKEWHLHNFKSSS